MGILESLKALVASEESAPTFDLAEGQISKIEVGRPGKFRAKVGGTVELTPEKLSKIATGFDPDGYHKLKLGHKEIDTDTPDMGDVVGVEWDPARERLFAAVRPTESLVEKNRKGEFRRISMELGAGEDLPLRHISFLGAHRPAISGLAPVHLAADAPGEIFLAADGDGELLILADAEEEKPPAPAPTEALPDKPLASTQENEVDRSKELKMAEEAVALAEEKERSARLAARIKKAAEERVDAILDRHKDKIPMALHKKGVKEVLMHFATKEGDVGDSVMLALPGEPKPIERSDFDLVVAMLAELPPLVAPIETTEIVKGGPTGEETATLPPVLASMTPDPEGDAYLAAALEEQNAARAKGETIDFAEAARRIYAKRGDRG